MKQKGSLDVKGSLWNHIDTKVILWHREAPLLFCELYPLVFKNVYRLHIKVWKNSIYFIYVILNILFIKESQENNQRHFWWKKCSLGEHKRLLSKHNRNIKITIPELLHGSIGTVADCSLSYIYKLALLDVKLIVFVILYQWCQTQFLEGHSSAEFSSKSHRLGSF